VAIVIGKGDGGRGRIPAGIVHESGNNILAESKGSKRRCLKCNECMMNGGNWFGLPT
jgi:hypothetical protein